MKIIIKSLLYLLSASFVIIGRERKKKLYCIPQKKERSLNIFFKWEHDLSAVTSPTMIHQLHILLPWLLHLYLSHPDSSNSTSPVTTCQHHLLTPQPANPYFSNMIFQLLLPWSFIPDFTHYDLQIFLPKIFCIFFRKVSCKHWNYIVLTCSLAAFAISWMGEVRENYHQF